MFIFRNLLIKVFLMSFVVAVEVKFVSECFLSEISLNLIVITRVTRLNLTTLGTLNDFIKDLFLQVCKCMLVNGLWD